VEWVDGRITVGFNAAAWQKTCSQARVNTW
jgi:hypothetical protein